MLRWEEKEKYFRGKGGGRAKALNEKVYKTQAQETFCGVINRNVFEACLSVPMWINSLKQEQNCFKH